MEQAAVGVGGGGAEVQEPPQGDGEEDQEHQGARTPGLQLETSKKSIFVYLF